jgi:hypothetical protein
LETLLSKNDSKSGEQTPSETELMFSRDSCESLNGRKEDNLRVSANDLKSPMDLWTSVMEEAMSSEEIFLNNAYPNALSNRIKVG